MIHRRPTQWRQDVERGLPLLQEHGPERLLAAFTAGVRQHAIGAEYAQLRGLDAARRGPRRASRIDVDEGGRYLVSPSRAKLRLPDDRAGDRPRRRLHQPTVRWLYPDLAQRAEQEGLAYREVLAVLTAEAVAQRENRRGRPVSYTASHHG